MATNNYWFTACGGRCQSVLVKQHPACPHPLDWKLLLLLLLHLHLHPDESKTCPAIRVVAGEEWRWWWLERSN